MKDERTIRVNEGLELVPTAEGIVVRTVDYHPMEVLLTWELLDRLRAQGVLCPAQSEEPSFE